MYISGANTVYVSSWTPYIDKGIYKVNEDLYLDITGKAYLHGVDINGNDFLTTHKDNPQNSESKDNLGPRTIKITNEIKKVIKRISVARETSDTNIVYNETNKTLSADYTLKAWDSTTGGNVLYTESEYPITIPAGKAYNKGWDEGLGSARASDISVSKRIVNNQEYYKETIDGVEHWLIPVTTSYKISGTKSGGVAYKSTAYVGDNTTLDFTSIYNNISAGIEKITIKNITSRSGNPISSGNKEDASGNPTNDSNKAAGETYTIQADVSINNNTNTESIEIDITKIIEELYIKHFSTARRGYNGTNKIIELISSYSIRWNGESNNGWGEIILDFQDIGPANRIGIADIIDQYQQGNINWDNITLDRAYNNQEQVQGPYMFEGDKYIDVQISYNNAIKTTKKVLVNDWPSSSSGSVTIVPLTATENKTYNEPGKAYWPVIVDVPSGGGSETKTWKATSMELGTYSNTISAAFSSDEVEYWQLDNNLHGYLNVSYGTDSKIINLTIDTSKVPTGGTIYYADDGVNYQYNDDNGHYWRRIWTDTDSVWIKSKMPMVVYQ